MKSLFAAGTAMFAIALFAFTTHENKRLVKHRFFNDELNGKPYIIIDKSDYELRVYDDDGWYASYPVVLGSKKLDDKMVQGDRLTPEGVYKIASKRVHEKWDRMMLIDYPTKADIAKFNERKAQGILPKNAKLGDGIGIHGTWQHDDMAVDYYQQWTNGCIALKNDEIEELYRLIPVGTQVTIQR
ncbi:MAG: L,D-transpeptidase [Chitinophagaceae bacterium]